VSYHNLGVRVMKYLFIINELIKNSKQWFFSRSSFVCGDLNQNLEYFTDVMMMMMMLQEIYVKK